MSTLVSPCIPPEPSTPRTLLPNKPPQKQEHPGTANPLAPPLKRSPHRRLSNRADALRNAPAPTGSSLRSRDVFRGRGGAGHRRFRPGAVAERALGQEGQVAVCGVGEGGWGWEGGVYADCWGVRLPFLLILFFGFECGLGDCIFGDCDLCLYLSVQRTTELGNRG